MLGYKSWCILWVTIGIVPLGKLNNSDKVKNTDKPNNTDKLKNSDNL
jgi:hypothetical protein